MSHIWLHITDYQGAHQQHETNKTQHCSVCEVLIAHQATRNAAIPVPQTAQSNLAKDVHACQDSD